jgi:shikimate dehydrogenase
MSFVRAGVIGFPIKHSKSPIIHNYWITQHGLEGSYKAIEIPPDALRETIDLLIGEGYAGFNVTIPHKETIFKLCDGVDERAQAIGAVNTVKIRDGKLHGTNTDAFGFIANIKHHVPEYSFHKGPAALLGAGGAARAIIYGLLEEGVPQIVLTNRTRDKAETLKAMAPDKITIVDWEKRNDAFTDAALIVNSTALGMTGKDALDVNLDKAPEDALVTDIVYAPLMTDLLKQAQMRGNPVVGGIGMLLHQARPAFHAWFGVMPVVTDALVAEVLK